MITKVEKHVFTQKCSCGEKHAHEYYDQAIQGDFIALPLCVACGSIEILKNTANQDGHSFMVSRIFAYVASLYSKDQKQKLRTDISKKPKKDK